MKYLLIILNWYRRTKQKCLDNYLDVLDPHLYYPLIIFLFIGCTKTRVQHPEPEACYYDSTALKQNFERANVNKSKRPKPRPRVNGLAVIYIDMDGQVVNSSYWNSGNTINCLPPQLSVSQKEQVVNEVSALFEAYNVTITDDESIYNSANPNKRQRVIVTPTSYWRPGVSGIAYHNSFTWSADVPAFVFSDRLYNGPHYIAEIIGHESGHAVAGLYHQSEYNPDCTLKYTYRMGVVMGNSLYVPQGDWIYGTTYSCNDYQDDHLKLLSVLGSSE